MESVDIEVTYGERVGGANYSSQEFRATIGRTVQVEDRKFWFSMTR